jgi:RNA polymerase sigma factor (TIGR02999 family)
MTVQERLLRTHILTPVPAHGPIDSHAPDPTSRELLDAVYSQLRAVAQQQMNKEGVGHSLQATALVHEAYLRIADNRKVAFQNKAHFFAVAAEAMRRILIDHARAKNAVKRGGGARREPLSVLDLAAESDPAEILALDDALTRLEQAEPDAAAVVRLRFFAGLSGEDTAQALGVSPRHVDSLWAYGRAWLARELEA